MITEKTYEAVMSITFWCCAECGSHEDLNLHHKLPRSKSRAKLYPLFIDSVFNLVPLCGGFGANCHLNHKHEYKISEREASVFESYLQDLKEGK